MANESFVLVDASASAAQQAIESSLTEAGGSIRVNTNKVTIATATGNTAVAGTLGVTGASTLASAAVTGAATVGTTLGVTGASTLASVGVTGAATVGTTLAVTGKTTMTTVAATGLVNYADEAAAITAGLVNGDLYHTAGIMAVVYNA